MRIGQGYDVHAFKSGDMIVIGGVNIPYSKGIDAHSDGDVLIHAICDAILGAMALGDIGKHFPDNAIEFENINSRILLRKVIEMMTEKGFKIGNIDATIVAQSPRMSPYIDEMRIKIASDCLVDTSQVNIKSTTTEKLGFIGKGEGIAAQSACLLMPL